MLPVCIVGRLALALHDWIILDSSRYVSKWFSLWWYVAFCSGTNNFVMQMYIHIYIYIRIRNTVMICSSWHGLWRLAQDWMEQELSDQSECVLLHPYAPSPIFCLFAFYSREWQLWSRNTVYVDPCSCSCLFVWTVLTRYRLMFQLSRFEYLAVLQFISILHWGVIFY